MFHLFWSSFQKGGMIMWPILGVSVVVWFIGMQKLFLLNKLNESRKFFFKNFDKLFDNNTKPLKTGSYIFDNFFNNLKKGAKLDNPNTQGVFSEFITFATFDANKGLNTMSTWISVAPLLGLLGTVTGMIETFRAITLFGVGNPHFTAEGISIALLTTQAGLTVAFPALLFHNILNNRKTKFISNIIKDTELIKNKLADVNK